MESGNIYSRAYFLNDCEGYQHFNSSKGKFLSPRLKKFLELADVQSGRRILDIGCGRGELLLHAAWRGAEAWGLDLSRQALQLAAEMQKYWSKESPELARKILLLQGEACKLPLATESFDLIFLADIIEHLEPTQCNALFCELRRVLRYGGQVVIHSSPNRIFHRWGLRLYWLLGRLAGKKLPWNIQHLLPLGCQPPFHVNEQSVNSLRRELRRTGFRCPRLWVEKNPHYVYFLLGEDSFISKLNRIYRFLPFPQLFFADLYAIAKK